MPAARGCRKSAGGFDTLCQLGSACAGRHGRPRVITKGIEGAKGTKRFFFVTRGFARLHPADQLGDRSDFMRDFCAGVRDISNPKKAKMVVFTPQPPPRYEDMTLEEVREHFETLLREAEDRLIARRRRAGKRVSGVRKVLQLDPNEAPSTRARRGKLNPCFASRDPTLMERALQERQQFHADYEEANAGWRRGNRSVVFPAGTIRHRKVNNADCRDPLGCEVTVFCAA